MSALSYVWAHTCYGGVSPTKPHSPRSSPRDCRGHVQQPHRVLVHSISHEVRGMHLVLGNLHVIRHWSWHRKGSGTLRVEGQLLPLHSNADRWLFAMLSSSEIGRLGCIVVMSWWLVAVAVCSLVQRVERHRDRGEWLDHK